MKKSFLILFLSVCSVFLLANGAFATTYTFSDDYDYWPGYSGPYGDTIGWPSVGDMTVEVTDGILDTVSISITNRLTFDSLYINADYTGDYEEWDFYLKSYTNDSATAYSVLEEYVYGYPTEDGTRETNPCEIVSGIVLIGDIKISYDGSTLTYYLSSLGIEIGEGFVIGYTPWCANDVTLGTPVPEPATMLLLGLGLLGLAGVTRKKLK